MGSAVRKALRNRKVWVGFGRPAIQEGFILWILADIGSLDLGKDLKQETQSYDCSSLAYDTGLDVDFSFCKSLLIFCVSSVLCLWPQLEIWPTPSQLWEQLYLNIEGLGHMSKYVVIQDVVRSVLKLDHFIFYLACIVFKIFNDIRII